MLNYSTSEENYIKAIFHLQGKEGTVTTNELAHELSSRPASITDMMKKLKTKKLLHYQPYRGFRLSVEGKKVALDIIRRHRLWEFFLAEKLKFSWDEVHEVAEDLEHVSSKKLIDKLDEFLGYPRFDPHGDPIPDIHGKIETSEQVCLSNLPINKSAIVSKVGDQSSEILELLMHKNISIGTRLEIKKKFDFDNSMEILIISEGKNRQSVKVQKKSTLDQPTFTISEQLAKNIFVQINHISSSKRRPDIL
ncbi:MAG: metal-dependent transcriptional regulator [Bacteroidia bacterium]|nr:metal-dependent transcriptional regulator [Bacteroidia bacterium]